MRITRQEYIYIEETTIGLSAAEASSTSDNQQSENHLSGLELLMTAENFLPQSQDVEGGKNPPSLEVVDDQWSIAEVTIEIFLTLA